MKWIYETMICLSLWKCTRLVSTVRLFKTKVPADKYQNVCGVSVVDSGFESLKRFNISEIFHPTPKEGAAIDANARVPSTVAEEFHNETQTEDKSLQRAMSISSP